MSDVERELAVARQTIRSLQNALADPDREAERTEDALFLAGESEVLREREQELTNALQRIYDWSRDGTLGPETFKRAARLEAREALAPAVEGCDHDDVSADNEVVSGAVICRKCKRVAPAVEERSGHCVCGKERRNVGDRTYPVIADDCPVHAPAVEEQRTPAAATEGDTE